jgi:hypothetical protein
MATKASRTIPNGTLYNYNPFTNIMPLNESWLYYKYTTTGVDLVHDLSLDSDKILLDANGDADIFVLYAGGGSLGETGKIVDVDNPIYFREYILNNGGGGGTGEVCLTKLIYTNINNKKINFNIGTTGGNNTNLFYNNNTIKLTSYGNLNIPNNINAGNSAIYNKIDRPINLPACINNTLFCGSAAGIYGSQYLAYSHSESSGAGLIATYEFILNGNSGILSVCNDFTNNNLNIQNNPAYLKNVTISDIKNGQNYLNVNNVNELKCNFSNLQLKSDNTSVGTVLVGGNSGQVINDIIENNENGVIENTYLPGNGQNGPNGFVMIFYKVKTPIVQTISLNLNLTSYNPINNIAPNNKYSYYYYKNSATHYVSDNYVNVNGIKPNANGKKIVNVLFVGGGGTGGSSSKRKGGGGGGGGGEVALSTIPFENIKNGIINIIINGVGGSTDIFYNDPSNKQFKFTAIAGYKGTNGDTDGKGKGGQGANGLAIRPNNSVITTFYGSGCGGGGSGLSNDTIASRGTIQPNVNSPNPTLNSNKCSRGVSIADIGDGTGEVQTSFGGWGGSGENPGKDGNPGFVLIYYLVYG